MLKLQKFVFSNKNIVGLICASIVVALGFFGIVKHGWFLVSCIAYAFGYLVGPKEKDVVFYHIKGENMADYIGFLNKFLRTSLDNQKLPVEAKNILQNITKNAVELLTFLQEKDSIDSSSEEMINLKSIFDTYIPKLVNQFSRLPQEYANNVTTSTGKTAKHMLVEQLTMLEHKIQEISYGMYEDDVTALKVNGRFLKEKFDNNDLFAVKDNQVQYKRS